MLTPFNCCRYGTGTLSSSLLVTTDSVLTPSLASLGRLTIESIEVTPIVVPLKQEYRGSYYAMRNRSPC